MSEIDNGKMRVFLSDVMFDVERDGKGGRVSIPFGKADCTVFRKVMSTEDTIHEFAPALRTEGQARAFRVALQTLGDLCGFGLDYFDLDRTGYLRTATEVSADNSALMRNIRRHEHALEGAIAGICHALLATEQALGEGLPDEGAVRVTFDDSIITDTSAEKRQDMDEVAAGLMEPWEYRAKWYGEDEETARRRGAADRSVAGDGGSKRVDAAQSGEPERVRRVAAAARAGAADVTPRVGAQPLPRPHARASERQRPSPWTSFHCAGAAVVRSSRRRTRPGRGGARQGGDSRWLPEWRLRAVGGVDPRLRG